MVLLSITGSLGKTFSCFLEEAQIQVDLVELTILKHCSIYTVCLNSYQSEVKAVPPHCNYYLYILVQPALNCVSFKNSLEVHIGTMFKTDPETAKPADAKTS